MRKRYKQITAVILAAMMEMQNGGVHVLASTDYSNKGSLHEEKNREGGAKKTATDSDAEKNAGKEKDALTASSADASREEPVTDPDEKKFSIRQMRGQNTHRLFPNLKMPESIRYITRLLLKTTTTFQAIPIDLM